MKRARKILKLRLKTKRGTPLRCATFYAECGKQYKEMIIKVIFYFFKYSLAKRSPIFR